MHLTILTICQHGLSMNAGHLGRRVCVWVIIVFVSTSVFVCVFDELQPFFFSLFFLLHLLNILLRSGQTQKLDTTIWWWIPNPHRQGKD